MGGTKMVQGPKSKVGPERVSPEIGPSIPTMSGLGPPRACRGEVLEGRKTEIGMGFPEFVEAS